MKKILDISTIIVFIINLYFSIKLLCYDGISLDVVLALPMAYTYTLIYHLLFIGIADFITKFKNREKK